VPRLTTIMAEQARVLVQSPKTATRRIRPMHPINPRAAGMPKSHLQLSNSHPRPPVTTGLVHTPAVFDPHDQYNNYNTATTRPADNPFESLTRREISPSMPDPNPDPFQFQPETSARNRESLTNPNPNSSTQQQHQQNPFDSEDFELGFGRRLYPMSEISSLSSGLPSPLITSPRTREASDLLNDRVRRAYAM